MRHQDGSQREDRLASLMRLRAFAEKKYLWWLSTEEALSWPDRLIAQVMDIGVLEDAIGIERALGRDRLKETLRRAEAGWFRPKSWHFWHYRLGLADLDHKPPPLPRRPFLRESVEPERVRDKDMEEAKRNHELKTFPPKLDTLPSPQRKLFPVLEPVSRAGFVLYGGTAVALRYGHRSSEDFDFFSSEPLDKESLFELVPPLKRAFVIQEDLPTTLVLQTRDGVKISFFGEIGFGRLGEPELTSTGALLASLANYRLLVASPLDLLATKLKVILQRANAKDYLDIAILLEEGKLRLEEGLAGVRALFGETAPVMEILRALAFFEDGDLPRLPTAVKKRLLQVIRDFSGELPPLRVRAQSLAPSSPESKEPRESQDNDRPLGP